MLSVQVKAYALEGIGLTLAFPLWQATQAAATCFRFDFEFWFGCCDCADVSMVSEA